MEWVEGFQGSCVCLEKETIGLLKQVYHPVLADTLDGHLMTKRPCYVSLTEK